MKNQLEITKEWFARAVPAPNKKHACVQLGVHFEEISEMLQSLSIVKTAEVMSGLGDFYKTQVLDLEGLTIDRKELLDSLCDQIVTAVGVAHMFGLDITSAVAEVNRSNYSKFDSEGKPIFNANGKITKGPNYSKPDLTGMF
jgi:predicted HAD superfamily Cof-like phosphohydrolase